MASRRKIRRLEMTSSGFQPCSKTGQLAASSRTICALLLVVVVSSTGCSVKKFAISRLGDSLASQSASSFATDDDPELVGDALPFALKLMEGLLDQVPRHRGLLFATSSGFTQYSYVWVQQTGGRSGAARCGPGEGHATARPEAVSTRTRLW